MKEYKVITVAIAKDQFEREVSEALNNGFETVGGVNVHFQPNTIWYSQAIVKIVK